MKLRLAAILGMALVAIAETAPRVTRQAASAVDAKEMAAVERIRARIEERAQENRRRRVRRLQGHDPEHDRHLRHGSRGRRRVPDGIRRLRRQA